MRCPYLHIWNSTKFEDESQPHRLGINSWKLNSVCFGHEVGQIPAHLLWWEFWCPSPWPGQGCWKFWRVCWPTPGTWPRRCSGSLCSSSVVGRAGICHLGVRVGFGLTMGICRKNKVKVSPDLGERHKEMLLHEQTMGSVTDGMVWVQRLSHFNPTAIERDSSH